MDNKSDIQNLDKLIEEFKLKNKKPEKILIGYKVYAELMNERQFMQEVVGSAMNQTNVSIRILKLKSLKMGDNLKLFNSITKKLTVL